MSILSGEQTHTYTQTEHLGTEMFSQCPVGCAQTLGHWEEGSPAVFGGAPWWYQSVTGGASCPGEIKGGERCSP